MKKILFMSDVDGTLVDGGYIHPRVAEAAQEFTARGHLFALATGRHKFSIGALCEQLPVNAPCIILAGAATYNSAAGTCENLFPMEEGVRAALARILAEYPAELAVQVFTARTQFNLRLNDFLRRHGIAEEVGKPDAPLSALQGEQILKLGFNCEDTAVLERCAAEFFSDKNRYEWHYSFRIGIEVCHPMAGKGNALRRLLEAGDVRADCIAVAGDSANDLPLFPCADVRFAPRDAAAEVLARADHVVAAAREGGVADALELLLKNA